jgi:hypothetical protein
MRCSLTLGCGVSGLVRLKQQQREYRQRVYRQREYRQRVCHQRQQRSRWRQQL